MVCLPRPFFILPRPCCLRGATGGAMGWNTITAWSCVYEAGRHEDDDISAGSPSWLPVHSFSSLRVNYPPPSDTGAGTAQ